MKPEKVERIEHLLDKSTEKANNWFGEEDPLQSRRELRGSIQLVSEAVWHLVREVEALGEEKEEGERTPSITPLEEFLNDYGLSVSCMYSQHTGKWHASLDNAEVVVQNRKFFKPPVETSDSLDEAVFYLAKRLRGEELKVEGGYVRVSKNLTYQYNE